MTFGPAETLSVEERLAKLEDEREIVRTMQAYGYALDYGDEDEWVDCWLPDAVLHWPPPTFTAPYEGRERIREAFRGHTHAPAAYHKHVVVDPRIRIEADTAWVVSYFARLDRGENYPFVHSMGRYLDVLKRCSDGRWRFLERRAESEGRSRNRASEADVSDASEEN